MANPAAADIIAMTGTRLSETLVETLIAQAALIAAPCLVGASDDLETATLMWLTAHLVASTSTNGTVTSRKLGDASKSYSTAQVGNGIMGTVYGQQAIALLPCLATAGRSTAVLEVI